MKHNPFPAELRTASFVSRWSILWSNHRTDIAQHSFYATLYARMIARVIKWDGPLDYLMFKALVHDLDESITGDIIGPAKKNIIDKDKAEAYIDMKMAERMGALWTEFCMVEDNVTDEVFDDVSKITKAADILEAVIHLKVEQRLGNASTGWAEKSLTAQLEGLWRALPADKDLLDMTWQTVVLPAIAAHETEGGRGV